MTIIESIRNYIRECPYLDEFNKGINVDYLGENTTSYMIEEVPAPSIIKKYIDGSSVRQYLFVFASREIYGNDVIQNIENSGFYEDFANWLEEQTFAENLPILDRNKEARSIEATTSGYLFNVEMDKASYQIQCRLTYFQK